MFEGIVLASLARPEEVLKAAAEFKEGMDRAVFSIASLSISMILLAICAPIILCCKIIVLCIYCCKKSEPAPADYHRRSESSSDESKMKPPQVVYNFIISLHNFSYRSSQQKKTSLNCQKTWCGERRNNVDLLWAN